MDPDELLLDRIVDIFGRLGALDPFQALDIAGRLRQLLTDGPRALVDRVRDGRPGLRPPRFRVTAVVPGRAVVPPRLVNAAPGVVLRVEALMQMFDPSLPPENAVLQEPHEQPPYRTVDRDGLLSSPVIWVDGDLYTVNDLIKHANYLQGAVHAGTSSVARDMKLASFCRDVLVRDEDTGVRMPAAFQTLQAVGGVVVRGLEPLRNRIYLERRGVPPEPLVFPARGTSGLDRVQMHANFDPAGEELVMTTKTAPHWTGWPIIPSGAGGRL